MLLRLCSLLLLFYLSYSQKFNYFKSYKDAAVKPKNYGRKVQRDHSVTEYLSPNQIKMLRKRKGPDEPNNMVDASWTGLNKQSRRLRESEQLLDLFHIPDLASSPVPHPPFVLTRLWWVYVLMVSSIGLAAVLVAAIMLVLCCLAIHPAQKGADDEEVTDAFSASVACVSAMKDMDA
jgi:hypothetical protein